MNIPFGKVRTITNLSTDMSDEEICAVLSETMGMPADYFFNVRFKEEIEKIRSHSQAVENIVADYKIMLNNTPKITKDKFDELFDIGRFIFAANNTEPLISKFRLNVPEKIDKHPDFVLLINDKRIGVEHTRLMNQDCKEMCKAADYYLKKAQEILKDLSHLSKTINIFIDYNKTVIGNSDFNNRAFTKEEKEQIANIIADFVRSQLTNGIIPKPNFIERITVTSNKDSRVDIELAETYLTEINFTDLLLTRINKKEIKASNYRKAVNVDQLWLLIVVDDNKSFSGFNLEPVFIPQVAHSNFDNILLFEKFGGDIIPLFSNKNA